MRLMVNEYICFSFLWGRTKSSYDFHFIPWPFVWFPFGWEDEAISNASRTSKVSRSYAEVGRARSKPKERGEKKYLKINQNIKEKKENLYITFNFRKEQQKKKQCWRLWQRRNNNNGWCFLAQPIGCIFHAHARQFWRRDLSSPSLPLDVHMHIVSFSCSLNVLQQNNLAVAS